MTTTILAGLTALLLLATGLSFLRVAHGFVRIFSFPRLQFLAVALVLLAIALATLPPSGWRWFIDVGLIVVIGVQATCIAQFLPVRRQQSVRFEGDPNGPDTVSVLSANIKQSNRNYAAALALADTADADLALFMETDQAWVDALEPLAARYPHVVRHPLENAYGMVLFSRLPLENVVSEYLVMEGIPSIVATVRLRDGQRFRLYCVHPEPPVPHIDSVGRDAELVKIASLVTGQKLPAIVTGDLNDVAWSNTTRLFQRLSRLLDPRVGRGFYNTFDARFFFMRWPLDHLFHDVRFRLVDMQRLPAGGSDHFPMYFKLGLARGPGDAEMPDEADESDREEARDITAEAKQLDRDPIGVDWES
ncbi:endonuclease/exonuclease/phosphatase family protein [Aureimonas sp. AU12]|uniref:endonuclease/exonuclease/phosphatase family protein n=1 Tax=Aureimonas sp. AU12 TaxID=1638161 RepID=UPI00078120C9|nr:endonuclease/exonuclease/phosphatase family protein [Aureimonas sp. AU12]